MATKQANRTDELLESIGGMTVLELSEFVEAFKEKFNVTAVAAPMAGAGVAAPGADGGAAEEKEDFDVVLESVGDKKIQVIKVVWELTGGTVKEAAAKDEAEQMKAKLEEVGATVALK